MTATAPTPVPAVLVMAKAPRAGTVKTRLQPLLGPEGCAVLQEALIRHTTELACGLRLRTYLAFDPPDARDTMRGLVPSGVRLLPQRGGHLGQRLAAAVEDVFADHHGPLVVLGTDAPTLSAHLLAAAFTALVNGSDAVLGPALDGGYYLIGMRAPHTRLFDIDPGLWSGDQVLAATLVLANRAHLRTELLPPLRDLDTAEDAEALLADPSPACGGDTPSLPADIAAALQQVKLPWSAMTDPSLARRDVEIN